MSAFEKMCSLPCRANFELILLVFQGQPAQPLHLHEHAHLDRGFQRNPAESFSSFQPQVRVHLQSCAYLFRYPQRIMYFSSTRTPRLWLRNTLVVPASCCWFVPHMARLHGRHRCVCLACLACPGLLLSLVVFLSGSREWCAT